MWSTGPLESNPILLLEPASSKPSKSKGDPVASYIGGTPSFFPPNDILVVSPPRPLCAICNEKMYLIIQMYAPLDGMDRSLLVFGCNNASCVTQAFQGSNVTGENFRFCLGGNGVFKCIRSQRKQEQHEIKKAVVQEQKMMSTWDADDGGWGDADDDDDDDDGWGGDTGDDTDWGTFEQQDGIKKNTEASSSMDELEAMLAVMEAKDKDEVLSKTNEIKSQQKHNPSNITRQQNISEGDQVARIAFPKYDLDVYDEPYISTLDVDSDDEDIQDTTNDKDIQHLLSKYLEEEDDSELVSAIKGGKSAAEGIGGGGGGEKYERLPPEERAFLTFTSRVKRAPKQSARYAYGGVPLWSIPTPLTTPKGKKGGQSRDLKFPQIPTCSCGAPREFECQVMPSILHIIGVDKFTKEISESVGPNNYIEIEKIFSKSNGGMNWGTIAVYSCSASCNANMEEFVIVQESADGDPKKREMKPAEGTNGGDDDEE